jgi:hypothetical protein
MERSRCRRLSTSSVQSNSSIANAQCSDLDTHAIVQRQTDNKVVLIPLENFINFGKVIKVNDTATFKVKNDSRKVDRGKVLVFGEILVNKYIKKFILFILFKGRKKCVLINYKYCRKTFPMKINHMKIQKASCSRIIKIIRMSFLFFVGHISKITSGEYCILSLIFTY